MFYLNSSLHVYPKQIARQFLTCLEKESYSNISYGFRYRPLNNHILLSNPAPQSSQVSRGSGTVAVEVLPDDWTSNINPTVLMVSGCLCIVSLVVVVFLISFRLWKKYWRPRKEKVIYLTRCKIFKINLSKFSCSL